MPESRSNSLRHWEAYYRGGALASCPLGPQSGYTLELRDIWLEFFTALPDGARILDIGTGNGAIALIAAQAAAAAAKHFEIHGTDLAQIDPVHDVPDGARLFAGIRFHPQVATERLPFEAASFDAASGQYALEYTDPDQSLPEIHRILKPGGAAQFVLHHAESIVARNARESLAHSALVLEDTKVLRRLRRLLEAERRSQAAVRTSRESLAAALETLARSARLSANPLTLDVTIDAVRKLMQAHGRLTPAALDREIDRFEGDLRAAARRLEDLVRCGQTQAQIERIVARARTAGFLADEAQLQHHGGGHLVGWRLRLVRPDGVAS
jgi:ubiquinone/menaquinone biosynthesis C-methylase UbiE